MRILVWRRRRLIGRAIAARLAQAGHTVVRRASGAGDDESRYRLSRDIWLPATGLPRLGWHRCRGETRSAFWSSVPDQSFRCGTSRGAVRPLRRLCPGRYPARGCRYRRWAGACNTGYFPPSWRRKNVCARVPWNGRSCVALVYGMHGASAGFFRLLASLPLVGLPGGGGQSCNRCISTTCATAVFKLLDPATPAAPVRRTGLAMRCFPYRHMLACYRRAMGFAPALQVSIPARIVGWTAAIVGLLRARSLTPDTWTMLQTGQPRGCGANDGITGPPRAA